MKISKRKTLLLIGISAGLLAVFMFIVKPSVAGAQASSQKGRLVPKQWASLSFPVDGLTSEILVKEGQSVQAGTTLARLSDSKKYEAKIAAAEQELLSAQQAYEVLQQNAKLDLALAEQKLAQAKKNQETAKWKLSAVQNPVSPQRIELAYANTIVAKQRIEQAQRNLRRAEHLWKDKNSFLWYFIPQHPFKMQLVMLRQAVVDAQAKYDDAIKKYNDLKKPVDQIDLAQAQADLAYANAQVDQATRDRDKLLNGPNPDDAAKAQAQIKTTEAALKAAQAAYNDLQLVAGFPGQVVSIPAKANEWTVSGQPFLYLADESSWKVEIPDLKETDLPALKVGQPARITFDALPDLEYNGTIESISLLNGEKDGDVTYKVVVNFSGNDPRLRWGLTSRVQFGP